MTDEEKLFALFSELQTMFVNACGKPHGHLRRLQDPDELYSSSTKNYLVATASGTLADRIFCKQNGDRVPDNNYDAYNERYQSLLGQARELATRMKLPCAGQ